MLHPLGRNRIKLSEILLSDVLINPKNLEDNIEHAQLITDLTSNFRTKSDFLTNYGIDPILKELEECAISRRNASCLSKSEFLKHQLSETTQFNDQFIDKTHFKQVDCLRFSFKIDGETNRNLLLKSLSEENTKSTRLDQHARKTYTPRKKSLFCYESNEIIQPDN